MDFIELLYQSNEIVTDNIYPELNICQELLEVLLHNYNHLTCTKMPWVSYWMFGLHFTGQETEHREVTCPGSYS